ncbi:MAG: MFS transporter [Petrimonas sp.]|nr:MFS transporter [Petrimonas sp.]
MRNKNTAFAANFIGIFLFGISMVIIGSTLPILKEKFGMTDIEAGSLFSILPVGILIGSVTFGPIADKFGYRWLLSVASLFLGLGFLGIAHAASMNVLRLCILIFGAGGGVINGATSALVSDLSETRSKIANLNWLGAFYGIGALCMPMAMTLIDKAYYTTLIDIACALSILVALLFAVISYPITVEKEKISFKLIPVFLKNGLFMAICFYLFFQSAFEAIVNNWSVLFFMDKLGVVQDKALMALSFSVAGMIVMRVLTGSVLKNLSYNRLTQIALVLLSIGLVCIVIPAPYAVRVAGLFFLGAGLAPGFPAMLGVAGEIFKGVSATAFSFVMVIALTGNIVINYITGILIDKYGTGVYLYVVLTEIFAMILIFGLIRFNEKKQLQNSIKINL